ncbi:hypothetical protein NE237_008798 [Protea cynaroides]|uniref:Uncharacterized protein n=1 Tax=Protea cynaroides TaxID=273540 RepID=A0A9Q0KWD0_9MAGN|nr:hypothetical protein NE237_008798 [Protea cynaroides]
MPEVVPDEPSACCSDVSAAEEGTQTKDGFVPISPRIPNRAKKKPISSPRLGSGRPGSQHQNLTHQNADPVCAPPPLSVGTPADRIPSTTAICLCPSSCPLQRYQGKGNNVSDSDPFQYPASSSREVSVVEDGFVSPIVCIPILCPCSAEPVPLATILAPSRSDGEDDFLGEESWYTKSKDYPKDYDLSEEEYQELEWLARQGSGA